ncbi:5-fold beta-flower protein, partial [Chryseobacterium sp. SIMBA_029]
MEKIAAICFFLFSLSVVNAQTIESGSRSTTGYIKSDGTIENSSRSTVGYIKSDGTIENKN